MNSPRVAILVCLAALLSIAGCNGRSYQVSSPVIGPVPPRESVAKVDRNGATAKTKSKKSNLTQTANVEQVSHEEQQPLSMTDVIAEVNGEPILAHEVLDRYSQHLAYAKQQGMPPHEIRKLQLIKIKEQLPNVIDQTLMVDTVKSNMKPEQLKGVEDQLDKHFEGEVERLMATYKCGSPTELEALMQTQGMSLVTARKNFGNQTMAGQFLRQKMGSEPTASREEMRERYELDIDTFTEHSEVKWQQVEKSYEVHKGVEEAEAAAQKLLQKIRSGTITFDEAAHKESDSPLASNGGHSDWTNPESLADVDMKTALMTLDVNEVSEVIPTKTGCLIVMVTGRHEAHIIPFNEVQKELHDRIVKDKRSAIGEGVLKKLKETAVVHTILEDEEAE